MGAEVVEGTEMLTLAHAVWVDARELPAVDAMHELLAALDYSDCPQFEHWLTRQRVRLRRAHCDALAAQASNLESEGKLAEAIAVAERLTAFAPLEEHAHRRLMHLHYLNGDRTAAIAAFEHCERVIKEELGARPDAETLALLTTIESASGVVLKPRPQSIPPSILRPPRMVGRDTEVAAVIAAWNAGRVPLVAGAGGMGKSRLLSEVAAHVDGVVAIRARAGDASVPYALLGRWLRAIEQRNANALAEARSEVLAALLREHAHAAGPASVTTSAVEATCQRVLAAALEGGVTTFTVDDLHWADAASLERIGHLVLDESLASCRWALARRPDEHNSAADDLEAALADQHRVVSIRLAPLGVDTVAELVDSLTLPQVAGAHVAAALVRHTGGNPLFVLETLKQAVLDGESARGRLPRPLGVVEALERRVAALSPTARSLVQVAAVAGPDFSVAVAEAVLATPAPALTEPWRELEAAQLIDGDAFVHDLVHEAVLDRVPQPIRRHLYAAIAHFLVQHRGDAARIADLWLAARDDEQAAPALVAAADAARRAGRFVEAGQRSEQAARAYDRLGNDARAFEQLNRAFDDFSTTTSRTVLERLALELDERARSDQQRATAALARAQIANMTGDWKAMESVLGEALVAAHRCGERALEAEARFGLGVALHYAGDFSQSIEQLSAATQLLDGSDMTVRQAEMRGSYARMLYLLGRVVEACAQLDKAIPVLRHANVLNELAADLAFRALVALETGDLAQALDLGRQSCTVLNEAEAGAHEWLTTMGDRARVLASASLYSEALELIAAVRADRRFERVPSQSRIIETEAAILFELGRGWQADRLLAPLEAIDGGAVGYRGSRAVLALQGQCLQARPVSPETVDSVRGVISGVPQRCRFAALAGPHLPAQAALQLCGSTLELAEGFGLHGHVPGLLASHADALLRTEQRHEAQRCAQRAVRLLETTTPFTYRGGIWLLLHDTLTAVGDAATARAVLLQASEWIHRTARQCVPPELRDSFLARNPVNRELLLRAIRAMIAVG